MSDVAPRQVVKVRATVAKKGKIVSRDGDIVAIPTRDGRWFHAVVITKNDFGTAYGLFEGSSERGHISADEHPPVRPHPVYSGDRLVGRVVWELVGHDPRLLHLFPAEPEIYHCERLDASGPAIGPYGAAESPSGRLRQLTQEEAQAIGLLDGRCSQLMLEEHLELCLRGELW